MNTKIIASLMVIAVAGILTTGATYALFSDTEVSANNTITAGTLDLQLQCPAVPIQTAAPLHPDQAIDTTGLGWWEGYGNHQLTPTELGYLNSSNDVRYTTQYAWANDWRDNTNSWPYEFLDFGVPGIPADATIENVNLTFEWQRGSGINAARMRIYNGSTWQIIYPFASLPTPNTDETKTIDLKALGIDTIAEIAALRIQFQATQSGLYDLNDSASKTSIDLVEVNVNYTQPGSPTWCADNLGPQFNVSNIKPGDNTASAPAIVTFRSNGSVGGTLKIGVSNITDSENTRHSPETIAGDTTDETGEMSQFLHLYASSIDGSTATTDLGTLDSLKSTPYSLGTITDTTNHTLKLSWGLPDTTDNTINQVQSDGSLFNIDFILEQQHP